MTNIILETPLGHLLWHEKWASPPTPQSNEHEERTHGVAVLRSGKILIFRQAIPSILIYAADGCFIEAWGNYPGAHGLTVVEDDGEEFLWVTDQGQQLVEKVTLKGRVVQSIKAPMIANHQPYVPTWVAVNETRYGGNGDVWIADGYGSNLIHRYDAAGKYISTLDGTEGAGRFVCPHGVWFDFRKRPMEFYIADRGNCRVQVYSEGGKYLRTFGSGLLTSPDGFASDGEFLIIPELQGRVTVLDADDTLICHLGSNDNICKSPLWPDDTLLLPGKFNSPHAAATDANGNIFVVEWRKGGRILKLEKLGA